MNRFRLEKFIENLFPKHVELTGNCMKISFKIFTQKRTNITEVRGTVFIFDEPKHKRVRTMRTFENIGAVAKSVSEIH